MVTSRKWVAVIAFLATFALLSAIAAFLMVGYETTAMSPTPVDMWFGIGFERRELEDALINQTISLDEYMAERERLIAQEDRIAKLYPRNMTEYKTYTSSNEKPGKHPIEFWIAISSTFIASIGSISGMLLSWRNDRRAAIETELKIIELRAKIHGNEGNA